MLLFLHRILQQVWSAAVYWIVACALVLADLKWWTLGWLGVGVIATLLIMWHNWKMRDRELEDAHENLPLDLEE